MNSSTTTVESVEAWPVPEHARIGTLPRHFGMHMLTVEGRIYDFLSQFCPSYDGGMWQFFELSNGFHVSGWKSVMERHSLVLHLNLPLGVIM